MKSNVDPYTWHENLSFRWIVLPVLAHLFSWMTGIGGIFLFPILLTVAQYLILKVQQDVVRPGIWFFTLPLTFYIWVKWGPLPSSHKSGDVILQGVTGYYIGQLINTVFIPLVVGKEKLGLALNWLLSHAAAFAVWLFLYKILITSSSDHTDKAIFSSWEIWVLYPAIALIANTISSFILTSRLVVTWEEIQ